MVQPLRLDSTHVVRYIVHPKEQEGAVFFTHGRRVRWGSLVCSLLENVRVCVFACKASLRRYEFKYDTTPW